MVLASPFDYLSFAALVVAFFITLDWWTRRIKQDIGLPREGWVMLAVLMVAGWFWVGWFGRREQENMRQALEGYAPVYAQTMELLGHSKLPVDNPTKSPVYLSLIEIEKQWLDANRTLADVYTCRRQTDGQIVFVVDSETDYNRDGAFGGLREERTPAGEPWRGAIGPELEAAFEGRLGFGEKVYTDRWGQWISAFYPLRRTGGEVEAVLGLDFDAALWGDAAKRGRLAALGYLGVAVLAVAGLSAETARHRRSHLRQKREEDRLKSDSELLQTRIAEQTRELRRSNAELRAEVASHQRAQAETGQNHREMLDAPGRVGMADRGATSVLQTVGNVLSSVSSSSNLIYSQLQRPILMKLQRLVEILEEQGTDLPGFLQTGRGRAVLPSLRDAAKHLDEERRMITGEAAMLQKHIEHIQYIVSSQQSSARVGGVMEEVHAEELLQDALNLNATNFEGCRISVVQAIAESPSLRTDRHKVLTILVNLLRNAKHALLGHERTDKRLILRAASVDSKIIRIDIEDNGIGIAPEHLDEILRPGFTTDKDGLGFGLHSCAVTAQELGGSLTVQSPGVGKGATFTLCLPISGKARPRVPDSESIGASRAAALFPATASDTIAIDFGSSLGTSVTAEK